jgi:hypothetical protein
MSGVTNTSASIYWAADLPATAKYRIKTNTSSFTSWNTLGEAQLIESLTANTEYEVEIRVGVEGNYAYKSVVFTTTGPTADTIAPTISYTSIGSQYNVSDLPSSIAFTLADNTAVTTLNLDTTNVFASILTGVYTLTLSRTV